MPEPAISPPANNRLKEKPAGYSGGRHPYPTSYRATRTFPNAAAADDAVVDYMQRYHPAGYGTQVEVRDLKEDGTVLVVLWWSHTCE
jgi:hypothetical protein